jgi:anti-anti-sigma regulatory factor
MASTSSYRRDMLSEQNGSQEKAWLDVSVQPGPVVRISGEIDMQSGPQLREQLLVIIRRYGARPTLDLTGVTYIGDDTVTGSTRGNGNR